MVVAKDDGQYEKKFESEKWEWYSTSKCTTRTEYKSQCHNWHPAFMILNVVYLYKDCTILWIHYCDKTKLFLNLHPVQICTLKTVLDHHWCLAKPTLLSSEIVSAICDFLYMHVAISPKPIGCHRRHKTKKNKNKYVLSLFKRAL